MMTIVALFIGFGLLDAAQAQTAAGDLDPAFSFDGKSLADLPGLSAYAWAMVVQPDGKAVVAGTTYKRDTNSDFAMVRFNTDGRLDTSFGKGGKVTTDFLGGSGDDVGAMTLQPDGKILLAGEVNGDLAVARYNTDGSLDDGTINDSTPADSFGIDGLVRTDIADYDYATAVVVQPNGRIVLAGRATTASYSVLVGYLSDGSLDTTFGQNGKVISHSFDWVRLVLAAQPDGKLVMGGASITHPLGGPSDYDYDFILERYNADGHLDDGSAQDSTPSDSFGSSGKVATDFGHWYDEPVGIIIKPDGKILVAGTVYDVNIYTAFGLALYNSDGSPDTGFGEGGRAAAKFDASPYDGVYKAAGVALQPDGKIVVAGTTITQDFGAIRFNTDGSLDDGTAHDSTPGDSFGDHGKARADFGHNDRAVGVGLQLDGKIIVGGVAEGTTVPSGRFAVARFLSSNTPSSRWLTLTSYKVVGSTVLEGTVKLSAPAPPQGVVVTLTDTLDAVTIPAALMIPAGETTGHFNVKTTSVQATETGYIIARMGNMTNSVPFIVRPPGVDYLWVNPNPAHGPNQITGTVGLDGPAPAGDMVVQLTSRNPDVASPVLSSITIPARARSRKFTIRVADVSSTRKVVITATANGIRKSVVLTVN